MNGENNQRRDSAIKTLAIIGFTATVVLGVWLAVQIVQMVPSAFSSLASLSESVYGKPESKELTAVTSKSVVNNAETFTLRWSTVDQPGQYSFTYECVEGVDVLIKNNNGEMVAAACDQPFVLPNTGETNIQVKSDKQRFIDVLYTLTFTNEGEREIAMADRNKFTVVNAEIPQNGLVAGAENNTHQQDNNHPNNKPKAETLDQTVTKSQPSTPITTSQPSYQFTYELPKSNPNGFVDLKATYLGVGELDSNDFFIPKGELNNDTRGAIKFSVTNIGTKTSDEWTYEVEMPNDNTYKSPKQVGLKPNETATIILGFTVSDTGTKAIKGEVKVANDRSNANNDFNWSVRVTD